MNKNIEAKKAIVVNALSYMRPSDFSKRKASSPHEEFRENARSMGVMKEKPSFFVCEVKTFGEACGILYDSSKALHEAAKGNEVAEKILAAHTHVNIEKVREEILKEKNVGIKEEFAKHEFTTTNEDLKKSFKIISAVARDMLAAGVLPETVDQKLVDNGFYSIANGVTEVKEPSVTQTFKELFKGKNEGIANVKNAFKFQFNKAITLG